MNENVAYKITPTILGSNGETAAIRKGIVERGAVALEARVPHGGAIGARFHIQAAAHLTARAVGEGARVYEHVASNVTHRAAAARWYCNAKKKNNDFKFEFLF